VVAERLSVAASIGAVFVRGTLVSTTYKGHDQTKREPVMAKDLNASTPLAVSVTAKIRARIE